VSAQPSLQGERWAAACRRLGACGMPTEVLEELAEVLARVDHPGTTAVELHHGPTGQVMDAEITPPSRRVRVGRG